MSTARVRRAAFVTAALLLSSSIAALAAEWGELRVAPGTINLRAARGTDAAVVGQLEAGRTVRVALEEQGWVAVFPPGAHAPAPDPERALGFVLARLLQPVAAAASPEDTAIPPPGPEPVRPPAADVAPGVASRREVLFGIARAIEQHEKELAAARAAVSADADPSNAETRLATVREQEELIETLRRRFAATAAGIDLDPLGRELGTDFEWSDELKELLAPVIQELKRATIRPRELDRLSREQSRYQEQLKALDRAFQGAAELRSQMESPTVMRELDALVERWTADRERAEAELAFATQRLEQLRGERTSIAATVRQLSQLFFKSRGRNLLLSIGALLATVLALRWIHGQLRRLSPLHRGTRGSAVRIFDLAFLGGEVVAATVVFMSVLYLTGDWVLLTLASVLLFGIAWASKTAIPRFWQQTMLLLNLGPVREGERLVYGGIPWRVSSIGVYSQLANPVLEGGMLRLPIRDLSELHSRPFGDSEPWFPTRKGDWVLAGDMHGRVVVQTPEVVTLVQLGGARVSHQAADFLAMAPKVLSTGFRLRSVFGVDYAHQAIAPDALPAAMRAYVLAGLERMNVGDHVVKLACELAAAGASSLDVEIILDLKGDAAPRYRELERALQRLGVEACNAHGWVIPFGQVTVHMAPSAAPPSAEDAP